MYFLQYPFTLFDDVLSLHFVFLFSRSPDLGSGDKTRLNGSRDRCDGSSVWAGHSCQIRNYRSGQPKPGRHQQSKGIQTSQTKNKLATGTNHIVFMYFKSDR